MPSHPYLPAGRHSLAMTLRHSLSSEEGVGGGGSTLKEKVVVLDFFNFADIFF